MQIIGLALISPWTTATWKALWNDSALVIFPVSTQHREASIDGVRYDDDGKGNALAVIFDQLTFEVRGHPHFSPERVLNLWNKLKSKPGWNISPSVDSCIRDRCLSDSIKTIRPCMMPNGL